MAITEQSLLDKEIEWPDRSPPEFLHQYYNQLESKNCPHSTCKYIHDVHYYFHYHHYQEHHQ